MSFAFTKQINDLTHKGRSNFECLVTFRGSRNYTVARHIFVGAMSARISLVGLLTMDEEDSTIQFAPLQHKLRTLHIRDKAVSQPSLASVRVCCNLIRRPMRKTYGQCGNGNTII